METPKTPFLHFLCFCCFCFFFIPSASSVVLRGIHPLDINYFNIDVINCKDGSSSFTKNRLNDDFCDCVDGTDEPDCCDGSDEYDGVIHCPNTCIMGGSIVYKTELHQTSNVVLGNESKPHGGLDMIQNLKDLKVLALLQLIILVFWALWLYYRRSKFRKRRSHV
ncbi:uncharacterized protein LOC110689980 isoform X2 [Chenopodium quinoa]|uniref:uncharacterized protein LOC110689980 isoform X2 n=1 Tax=Chenopodium quinoa TaxID=63459 RepID=UPI000B775D31|nr:uncharacterized protein LOC110689980 isoform X2 [Chenopodium quinoa]